MRGVRRTAAAITMLAMVGVPTVACGAAAAPTATEQQTETSSLPDPATQYNAVDVAFAKSLIALNQQTIDFAFLVEQRCANRDLVPLASALAAEATSDNEVLKPLLVQWTENPDASAGPSAQSDAPIRGLADDATAERLSASTGTAFDTVWLETMSANRSGALEQARTDTGNGHNDDARAFARTIVGKRTADIDRIRAITAS